MILRTIVKWNNGSELIHFLTAGRAHERLHMIKEEKEKKKKKKLLDPITYQPSSPVAHVLCTLLYIVTVVCTCINSSVMRLYHSSPCTTIGPLL